MGKIWPQVAALEARVDDLEAQNTALITQLDTCQDSLADCLNKPPPVPQPVTQPSVLGTTLFPLIHPAGPLPAGFFAANPQNVINAWNGAAYDYTNNRMILAVPGGHNDWYWNESFNVQVPYGPSTRLHDGTPCPPTVTGPDVVYGDKPGSRHTYNGTVYMPSVGKVLLLSGSTTGEHGTPDRYVGWLGSDGVWEHKEARMPDWGIGLNAMWHEGRQRVIYGGGSIGDASKMYAYDPATDTHTLLWSQVDNWGSGVTMTLVGDYVYAVSNGGFGAVKLKRFDLTTNTWQDLTVTGETAALTSMYPGVEHDDGALVFFSVSDPAALTVLPLDTLVAERIPIPAVDVSKTMNGIFGRFRRHAPGKFCLLADVTKPLVLIDLEVARLQNQINEAIQILEAA
jgi:hypothetical protein